MYQRHESHWKLQGCRNSQSEVLQPRHLPTGERLRRSRNLLASAGAFHGALHASSASAGIDGGFVLVSEIFSALPDAP